jgi:hypothetical protein
MEGVQITNNIMWFNGDHASAGVDGEGWYGITVPNCSFIAKQMMDCVFTQGAGNPSYTFANNLLVPYYLNSQAPNGNVSPSTLSSVYSGFPGVITQSGSQPSDRLAGVGFVNPASSNLQLSVNSPYLGKGSDGRDLGANIQQLNAAQGVVRNVRVADVTRTGANLLFMAADGKGCPVDFSTSENFARFTRVKNAGEGWKQQAELQGLKSGTVYYYRVLCAAQQPAGTFTTAP